MSDARQVFSVTPVSGGAMLKGELDALSVSELEDALESLNGGPEVTLDLSGLTFIDSSGMHAIVAFARSREPDATVTLGGVSPFVTRLFEITNLAEIPNLRIDG